MNSVLITGGAGFIGTSVARRLADAGWAVVTADTAELARVPERPEGWRHVIADVRDEAHMDELVRGCTHVVHLAAVAQVAEYLARPAEVLDVNVLGARNVLRACVEHGRPLLLGSSSEVYGRSPGPLRETDPTLLGATDRRRWSYATSKLAAEHYAFALAAGVVPLTVVRYFNVYGPQLDAPGRGRVVSRFLGHLRDGTPLPLVDGGAAVRCFCYVDDAARATVELLTRVDGSEPLVVNVGRDEPITIRRLAELMAGLAAHAAGVADVRASDHFAPGFEDIDYRRPDLSRLAETIGYVPDTPLVDGLRRTLAHWRLLADHAPALTPPALPMVRPTLDASARTLGRYETALRSGRVTNDGPRVHELEARLSAYLEVEHVVSVASGSAGLLLCAAALGLRGRVVMPAYTYIATANAFVHHGLEPVFCDIDETTFTLSPDDLTRLLADTGDVAAVVAVNCFGVPPALDAIAERARAAGATLLYDDAHGFGSVRAGKRTPPEALARVLSFHATKLLPAVEGGAVTTSDAQLARELRRLRNHGLAVPLEESTPGYNAKLDELRAITALATLDDIDGVLARRGAYAARLRTALERNGHRPQRVPEDVASNFQNLGVLCASDDLDAFSRELGQRGVEARRYFHPPLHRMKPWRGGRALPATDAVWRRLVCLPLYSRMTEAELEQIETAIDQVGTCPR